MFSEKGRDVHGFFLALSENQGKWGAAEFLIHSTPDVASAPIHIARSKPLAIGSASSDIPQ